MLNPDRLTVKATGAIQDAARESRRREHPQIEGVHLLQALLDQEEGIVVPVLAKLGTDPGLIRERIAEALAYVAREEGILGGISGGANVFASLEVGKSMSEGQIVVTIIADNSFRYFSTELFQ